MKRFSLPLLLSLFSLVIIAGNVEKIYTFSNYKIEQNGSCQSISLSQTMLAGLIGEPMLPYHQVALMLPPGEKATSIQIAGTELTIIPGSFQLFPQQAPQPISKGPDGIFRKNEAVYRMNTNYPVNPAGHLINAFLNGYSFALSTFTPVIYNPVTGSLEYYKKVTVHISTCPDNQASEALSSIPSSENALRRVRLFAQNGSMMDREFEPGAQRWVHYDCNVLGDPALKVWTGNTAAGLVHDNLYADFKLSPNPATVNIILSFTLEVNSRCKVTITNSLGQPLLSRSAVEYPPGTHAISMNINGLADGLYFCRFENAQGGATRKIVVMR